MRLGGAFSYPMSPTHLPPEILSEIFRQALPRREPSHLLPFEVLLSHVSLEWRNAILADASIWSTINIYSPNCLGRAKTYLARSGLTAPLNIRVELYDHDRRYPKSSAKQVFIEGVQSFIRSCIERCKALLIFTCRQSTCSRLALGLHELTAPSLERLRINTISRIDDDEFDEDEEEGNEEEPDLLLSQGAPSLRFLEVEALHMYPPLANILTLHLHDLKKDTFTANGFKNIAKAAPRLQNLSLQFAFFGLGPSWAGFTGLLSPVVALKSLHALKIEEDYPSMINSILLAIDAPKLQSLWLAPANPDVNFDFFLDSIQFAVPNHKFCNVKYLTLASCTLRHPEKWGQVFPNLEHFYLTMATSYISSAWFASALSTNPPLWPKLQTLAIDSKSARAQAKVRERICHIVSARLEMRVGLKTFLSDEDYISYFEKHPSDQLNESIKMDVLSTTNFREPWWLMAHEKHPDSIGLS